MPMATEKLQTVYQEELFFVLNGQQKLFIY